mgnify:CR=1 FL=1
MCERSSSHDAQSLIRWVIKSAGAVKASTREATVAMVCQSNRAKIPGAFWCKEYWLVEPFVGDHRNHWINQKQIGHRPPKRTEWLRRVSAGEIGVKGVNVRDALLFGDARCQHQATPLRLAMDDIKAVLAADTPCTAPAAFEDAHVRGCTGDVE